MIFFDAVMKTGFAFRNELDSIPTVDRIRNQGRLHSCLAHSFLLSTFPAIWMTQDKHCRFQKVIPRCRICWVYFFYEILAALQEVGVEVSKNVVDGFARR